MAGADMKLNIPLSGGGGKGGFGAAITEKLVSSISNMDVAATLQKMVSTIPEDEESEEIRTKLNNVIEKLKEMTDEEKAEFTNQVKEGLMSKIGSQLEESGAMEKIESAISWAVYSKLGMIAVIALIVITLFVFFGYKLYKSIKDKEKKREEKKKAKQSKKKK